MTDTVTIKGALYSPSLNVFVDSEGYHYSAAVDSLFNPKVASATKVDIDYVQKLVPDIVLKYYAVTMKEQS